MVAILVKGVIPPRQTTRTDWPRFPESTSQTCSASMGLNEEKTGSPIDQLVELTGIEPATS
jgi:hypothetical protein